MRRKLLLWTLRVVVCVAIYLLPFLVTFGKVNATILFGQPGGYVHLVSTLLLFAYAYFNHYVLVPKLFLQRRFVVYALVVIACVLLVIWFPNVFRVFEIHDDFQLRPPGGHRHGPHGPRTPRVVSPLTYNIILFIISTFASISIRQQRKLLEVQQEKLNAELSFLKAQINPHFLFNTLNSIYALAIVRSDDTARAITQLSELMRYVLLDADADTVALDRELNYIGNYVALQRRRLGSTVRIDYSAPTGPVSGRVAPLILMSFVENAFKHGINPSQDSAIDISITVRGRELKLSVLNNKVTRLNVEETMGIGLRNAISRLEHYYPGKHKLDIVDGDAVFSVNLILELHD
jgi:hypothetical protein